MRHKDPVALVAGGFVQDAGIDPLGRGRIATTPPGGGLRHSQQAIVVFLAEPFELGGSSAGMTGSTASPPSISLRPSGAKIRPPRSSAYVPFDLDLLRH